MTDQEKRPAKPEDADVLPPRLYPAAFWVALPVLTLSLLVPALAPLGLWFMMAVPAVAAVAVAARTWNTDRRVSLAALTALAGLALVYLVKGWLTGLTGH